MKSFILLVASLFVFSNSSFSSDSLIYIINNGQWHKNVEYKVSTSEGSVFLEKNKIKFTYYSKNDLHKLMLGQDHHNKRKFEIPDLPGFSDTTGLRYHSIDKIFLNSNKVNLKPIHKIITYFNYFLGNDSTKWKGKVPAYQEVYYPNIYNGINLRTYSQKRKLKYDFIVLPNANPQNIQIQYKGADKLRIKKNELIIYTSLGEKIEQAPFAYQIIGTDTVPVICNYKLKDDVLSFGFPNGYKKSQALIIDPTLVASTFSGVQNNSENYGHSATYDMAGNMYMGARSYGPQYMVTTGAFMTSYPGGGESIGISKFNPDGSHLIYGTLIGSSGIDDPHSIVVSDDQEELYLLGSTEEETDYPSTSGAFQPNFNDDGFESTEIVISRFSTDGTTLIASTFLGGVDTDGDSSLDGFDSHDDYRGEIIHKNGKVYVACFAQEGFPITSNAIHTWNPDGGQEPHQQGVFLRMSEDLADLEYSSYFGSAGDDDESVCHGIKVDNAGNMYVTGLIHDASAPYITWNGAVTTSPGGRDAYVIKVSPTGTLLAATLFGTANDDLAYFVDITNTPVQNPYNQCATFTEEDTYVYIFGLTKGTITPSPGIYSDNPNAKQFVAKFSNDLSSIEYQTVIGHNSAEFNFIPVAFMVDMCGRVYISGYDAGEGLETQDPLSIPNDISTSGDNFYVAVLTPDASALQFASYYYGANHVDGGTSRFDPRGFIYQGVCTSDDGYLADDDYLTTAGAAFPTSDDGDFDEAIFKIDLGVNFVQAEYAFASDTLNLCAPGTVDFGNNSMFASDYEWDFGDGTTSVEESPTHVFTSPGTYSIMLVAHDDAACNVRDTFCMTVNIIPCGFTIAASDTAVCGSSPASVYVDVFEATEPITYEWSSGLPATAGPHSVNPTVTTEYYVTVTDGSGESIVDTATVIINENPSITGSVPDLTCGLSSVAIDISLVGGNPTYTYNWEGPGGFTSTNEDPNVSNSGTYTVTVIDQNSCQDIFSIDVGQVGGFTLTENHVDVLCYGENTGSIDISISGGTSPFSFDWDNDGVGDTDDDEDLSLLTAGTYNLTVTDSNSCQETISVSLTQPDSLLLSNTTTLPDCQGNGGAIDLTVSGGTAVYSYEWEGAGGLLETSEDIVITVGGLYTVTVTDANACQDTMQVNIVQAGGFTLTETHQNIVCYGGSPTSVDLTVSGGTPSFAYVWEDASDPGVTIGTSEDISGLIEGTYNVVVTDANSCTGELQVVVDEPDSIVIEEIHVDVDCYTNSTGLIDITVSGGTPDYNYEWNFDGVAYSTNEDLNSLENGSYNLSVTDANNCKAYLSIEITEPDELIASETHFNATCGGNDGSIDLTVSGGVTEYNYYWEISTNPGVQFSTNQDLSNLNAGTYNLTITDNNLCETTQSITITQPDNNLQGVLLVTDASCNGKDDGEVNLTVTGGTPNYSFVWSNSQTSEDISNLTLGVYSVTITDNQNCSIVVFDTVSEPTAILPTATINPVSCSGGSDGEIDLTVTGGTPNYTFEWSNSQTSEDIVGVAAGTYTVTITDANVCQEEYVVTVGSANTILTSLTPSHILCYGDINGAIDLNVSGGTPNYSYAWSNSSTTQDISGLTAGLYIITVTDANNCFVTDSIEIVGVGNPLLVSADITNIKCNGKRTGEINLLASGGTPNYSYEWEDNPHNTPHIRPCYAGDYEVTVSDANGCLAIKTYNISEPEPLVSLLGDSIRICQNIDVNIDASVTGGVSPYTYLWSNSSNLSYITVNQDTVIPYFLTVTDVNNCILSTNIGVYVHPLPELILGHDKDTVCQGEPITIGCINNNGVAPFTYTINDEIASNSNTVHPEGLTNYSIVMTDACGYTDIKELNLFAYTDGLLNVSPDIINGCSPLKVNFTESSGLEGIWGWEFDDKDVANYSTEHNPSHQFIDDGLYTIKQTLLTKEGCYLERTYRNLINVYPLPEAEFDVDNDIVSEIVPDVYFYNYSNDNLLNYWNFGDGNSSTSLSPSHRYKETGRYLVQLVVENIHMCRDTTERLMKVEDVFKVWVPSAFTPDGDNKNELFGVYGVGILDDGFSLMVFDRWGEMIWDGKNQSDRWDGKYKGNYVQNGVYSWMLICRGINGSEVEKAGSVTVIR